MSHARVSLRVGGQPHAPPLLSMRRMTIKRRLVGTGLVVALTACATSCSNGPSCSQAMTSFYNAGCAFRDGSGSAVALDAEIASCQTTETEVGSNSTCDNALQAYLSCLDGVAPLTSDPTTCTSCYTQQAMVTDCQLGSG
jgi:hypothetical protein